jgi:succinyl-diaminopimelate desuccinylase
MPPSPAPEVIRERLAEHTLTLLKIPSVTGNEAAITKHLERWAVELPGLGHDDVVRYGNALVVGNPDELRPCVALVGHTDTVPAHDGDMGGERQGDRIRGLGASDMKGSLAVMQVLAESLDLVNLPFSLVLVFYDREEGPYKDNGLQPLLERCESLREIDLALAMEPTDNTLQLGCVGSLHARVVFHGKAAHSARPWQGENAVHKAGPFLTSLSNRPSREVNVHGLVFREAIGVTLAQGGRARNVVPERFELNVNYRFAPTEGADAAAIEEIRRLAKGAEVEVTDVSPAGPIPENNPIYEHLRRLSQLPVEPKQAWTDVARLATFGIDAINFGPGMGAQAHQKGEWISLEAMVRAYDILRQVLTTPL